MARNWKQPRCPPTDEWVVDMGACMQRNIIQLLRKVKFSGKWMDQETIILISPKPKGLILHASSSMCMLAFKLLICVFQFE